jgi:hypothetical protein
MRRRQLDDPPTFFPQYFSQFLPFAKVLSDFLTHNGEQLPCPGLGPIPDEGAEYGRRQTRG